MDIGMVLGVIGFIVGVVVTPVLVYVIVKGVRSLTDIRDLLGRPPGDYGRLDPRRGTPSPGQLDSDRSR